MPLRLRNQKRNNTMNLCDEFSVLTEDEMILVRRYHCMNKKYKIVWEDILQEARLIKLQRNDLKKGLFDYCRRIATDPCAQARKPYDTLENDYRDACPEEIKSENVELLKELLQQCVLLLSPKQYQIIFMRFVQGLSEKRVAEILCCKRQTINSHALAALKILHKNSRIFLATCKSMSEYV